MSHNRQIELHATHAAAAAATAAQDQSSSSAAVFTTSGQPAFSQQQLHHHHQQQQQQQHLSSPSFRSPPPVNSTLADSLRALRDHKTSTTNNSKSLSASSPSAVFSLPALPLSSPTSPVESLASRRKGTKPSPLTQQDLSPGTTAKLYGRQGLNSPLSPTSLHVFALPPLSDLPASPKERIEALLAQSPAIHNKENSSLNSSPRKNSESAISRQLRSNAQARKASLPSSLAQMSLSPPISPTSTITTSSPRPANVLAVMQRNSSIDSTVSTVSSTTTNSQATRQGSTVSKPGADSEPEFDAASFVAQAGSVEAALNSLWKDKQNAANHNAQLWRLVEKQRAVLLGLQKDMDKAFKEREKYRKKLKDHMASCPSAQTTVISEAQDSAKDKLDAKSSAVPSNGATVVAMNATNTVPIVETTVVGPAESVSETLSPKTNLVTPKPPSHSYQDSETLGNMSVFGIQSEDKRQTTINLAEAQPLSPTSQSGTVSDHTSLEGSPVASNSARGDYSVERTGTPLTDPSVTAEMSPIEKETPKVALSTHTPSMSSIITPILSPPPTTMPPSPPTGSITNSAPALNSSRFPSPPLSPPSKPALTTRKQVPAPLNLLQSNVADVDNRTRQNALSPTVAVQGEDEFVPDSIQRGRRRTRQDDDMVREAITINTDALHSASILTKTKSVTPLASPAQAFISQPATTPLASPAIVTSRDPVAPSSASPVQARLSHLTAGSLGSPIQPSTPRSAAHSLASPAQPATPRSPFVAVASSARLATLHSATTYTASPSQPPLPDYSALLAATPLATSPVKPVVQTIPPSPHIPANMSALLSPALSDSSTRANRTSVFAPFASPGLPVSPRPEHRPASSPLPRSPKQAATSSLATTSIAEEETAIPSTVLSSENMSLRSRAAPPAFSLPQIQPVEIGRKRVSALPAPLFAKKSMEPAAELMQPQEPPQRAAPAPPPLALQHMSTERNESRDSIRGSLSIFKGFASEQYPGLLIAPNALPLVQVRVVSSRMRPSRNSILLSVEEDPVFLLGIYSRSDNKQLWRVEKNLQALPALHNQMRSLCVFESKLPDASLFQGHAPAKIDARREALNAYFASMLDSIMTEDAAVVLCEFFSIDALEPEKESSITVVDVTPEAGGSPKSKVLPSREGYLTKRGKNFGGWKARYFMLNGPELKYYDNPGGPQIGVIKLFGAQIGKQSSGRSSESPMGRGDDDNQYRHAFLVLEPKKRDTSSYVRHVLCAESDEERDAWVEACLAYFDVRAEERRSQSVSSRQTVQSAGVSSLSASQSSSNLGESYRKNNSSPSPAPAPAAASVSASAVRPDMTGRNASTSSNPFLARVEEHVASRSDSHGGNEQVQTLGLSYESTVQAEAPTMGRSVSSNNVNDSPSPSTTAFPRGTPTMGQKEFTISGPTNGTKISDMASWGLRGQASNGTKTSAKEKKRSIFGFGSKTRSSSDLNVNEKLREGSAGNAAMAERAVPLRSVFGMPLAEAVEMCPPDGVDVQLPAVVYRCIDYLRAMDAADEEGIFRLSGSNVTIKSLRERFSREGDIDLLDGEYCDIHAVASLLKLYLRELPQSILTRDLHMNFLNVNGLDEHQKKIRAANVLVHKLPTPNFYLLRALCGFLQEVVQRSDKNKMNVRNVGIVFAPTLNVAAWLISLLLTDFDGIFGDPYPEELSPIREVTIAAPEPSDPVRSPRQQVFTDLPTPTHNQTSFPSNVGGFQPMNNSPSSHSKIQSRTTYVPLGPQMHSQMGNRRQPAPIGPQHKQTQPHNEWAGPASTQVQQEPQPMRRPQQHPSFPHPAALSVGAPQSNLQTTGSPQIGYSNTNSYNQNPQNGFAESRRNRRESAMMGGDVGYIAKRPDQKQTLRDTNSSRLAPPSVF